MDSLDEEMEKVVREYGNVYEIDSNAAMAIVRDALRKFEIAQIELIIKNQKDISADLLEESKPFGMIKMSFYLLCLMVVGINFMMFENSPLVYSILGLCILLGGLDTSATKRRCREHQAFAKAAESQLPYFVDYAEKRRAEK